MKIDRTNAVRFPLLKTITAQLLCSRVAGRMLHSLYGGIIPYQGCRIEVPSAVDQRISAMLFWGIYESAEVRFVQKYIDTSLDVIELGSSIGGVSCVIASQLAGSRSLWCVEANTEVLAVLRRNLSRNIRMQNFNVIHGAVAYGASGTVNFTAGPSTLTAGLYREPTVIERSMNVPSVTLADVIRQSGYRNYALVCDIEGAEVELVKCDSSALAGCRRLIIELHTVSYAERAYEPNDIIALIEASTSLKLIDLYGPVAVFQHDA